MAISLARYFVSVRGDFTTFRAEVAAEATRLSRTAFEIKPRLELTGFRGQWSVFAARYLSDQTVRVRPVMIPGGLSNSAFGNRVLQIKVRLDLTAFRAQWRAFAATYLNVIHRIHVHPVISPTAVNGIVDAFGDAGSRSGSSFGGGFSTRWKLIVGLLVASLPLLQPLIGVLGSILQAAGAVGAALPLALASLGVIVATLALSFHNLGTAIEGAFSGDPTKKQREAYAKLAPAAKEFVQILLATRTQLRGFQTEVQQAFFVTFLGGFKELVASPAIKQLRRELVLIAKDAGDAGGAVSRAFADSAKSGQFATILAGIRGSFDQILALAGPLTKMFLTLMQAAQPLVDMLVDKLGSSLTQLTMLVERSAANGALTKFFDEGARALAQLMRLIVNVGDIFGSIFDGMTGGSNTFLESLSVVVGKFADWLKSVEGQKVLAQLADELALIGEIFSAVIAPLVPLLIDLGLAFYGPLVDGIRTVLPQLSEVIKLLVYGLSPILAVIAPLFRQLVEVVAEFIERGLIELGGHIGKVIPIVTELVEQLGPHMTPVIEALGEVLMAFLPLIPTLSDFIISLIPTIVALIPLFIAMTEVTVFLWKAIAVVIGWIIQIIGWFLEWAVKLNFLATVVNAVTTAIRVAWDAVVSWFQTKIVVSLREAVDQIRAMWDGLVSWFQTKIVVSLKQALEELKALWRGFQSALKAVDDFLRALWDGTVTWFRTKFYNPLNEIITNKIPHAFRQGVDLISFWWDRLKAVARIPVEFFVNTVVNKGIVGTFNRVAGWIPGLGKVDPVPGFAAGGEYSGMVAGPPSTVDNRIARGPHGEPIALATGEMVVNSTQTRKHRGLLHAINSGIMGYADGGLIGAITDPVGWVKGQIGNLLGGIPGGGRIAALLLGLGNKIVGGLISFVKDKLFFGGGGPTGPGPGFGAWPFSPMAQRGDSGVWRSIMALVRSTGIPYRFGNAYRPGDPLWHGSGRAVDLMGFNQDALGAFFLSIVPRVLELIHTTPRGGYYASRGRRRASMGRQDALHRDHLHIAMAEGGIVGRVMDSGGWMMPGWNPPTFNGTGKPELVLPSGATIRLDRATIAELAAAIAGALTGGMTSARRLGRQYA